MSTKRIIQTRISFPVLQSNAFKSESRVTTTNLPTTNGSLRAPKPHDKNLTTVVRASHVPVAPPATSTMCTTNAVPHSTVRQPPRPVLIKRVNASVQQARPAKKQRVEFAQALMDETPVFCRQQYPLRYARLLRQLEAVLGVVMWMYLVADYVNVPEIGMIVHWGLYAVPAFDCVALAMYRKIQNGSEWYAKRLSVRPGSFRPTSGWKETQAYHKCFGTDFPYARFGESFTAEHWDVDAWMVAFKNAGGTYAVLTAKHHDGFCLWSTKTSGFSCAHAASKEHGHTDLLRTFKDACTRHGLKFGIYYSWWEFDRPCTKKYVDTVIVPQIKELVEYEPDLVWLDGDWPCASASQYAQRVMDQCVLRFKHRVPHVQINDRIGHAEERKDPNWLGSLSTYRVYEDRAMPAVALSVPWEHATTIGAGWGRNTQQTASDYKPAKELVRVCDEVARMGGRFLLNVGPNADGTICHEELTCLASFGTLLA